MMDRQKGKIVFECDSCGETLYTETGDFYTAKEILDGEEWKTRKYESEWNHFCPKCEPPSLRSKGP